MKYSAQHRDGSLSCRQCNKPLNHSKNDCCERLTLQYKEQHFSVADTLEPARADFTVWSAYDAMYKTLIVYGQMNKREKRDRTTSVSRITKRKGQKFKTCNKWLTDASTDTGASTYSLGTRHKEGKETGNPVLIFWLRKINQCFHRIQTDSANKTYPVGFHSFSLHNFQRSFSKLKLLNKIMASKLGEKSILYLSWVYYILWSRNYTVFECNSANLTRDDID